MTTETRAITETAVDPIITIDGAGIILTFNRAAEALLGYRSEEAVGANVTMLMAAPEAEQHDEHIARYLRTREPRIIGVGREVEAIGRDGRPIPIHLSVSEYRVGGEVRFLGIIRDLTALKSAEAQVRSQTDSLAHAGRLSLMGEMTAAIAHEINQPLTAIAMYAEASAHLIDGDEPNLDKIKDAIAKMKEQSLRAGAVIERIQRLARGEIGERAAIDLNMLMQEVTGLVANDARLHDISINEIYAIDMPEVRADPVQIQQVALNLIRNAIDAMDEPGEIRVETSYNEDFVRATVSDSGAGVDTADAEDLFTPFHTTKTNGTGMGLPICKTIIDEHGGHIGYFNNPDRGATFYYDLPRTRNDD